MRFLLIALLMLFACATCALAVEEEPVEITTKINFIYISCNDHDAMREFYSELIGVKELSYHAGKDGWLVYDMGGFQFMIFPAGYELPVVDGWGMQPGWAGGDKEVPSWSLIVPEDAFADVVGRLKADQVASFNDTPQWCQDSYWSFPVRDPMGHTVEIHTIPNERPASTEWAD